MKYVKRTIKRTFKKATNSLKKRYFKGKGYTKPKLSQMAKDIAIVKSMVNAEKELYTQNLNGDVSPTSPIGPVAIANVAEGTAHGERDGQSIKLHAYQWDIRVASQTSAVSPRYVHIYLIKYIGPRGSAPAISTFLKPDFDGNYSTYSKRNEDHYGSYIVVARKNVFIPADTVSGVSMYKQTKVYGRFKGNCHQRYSGALQGTLLTDQMYFMAVSSDGTIGTSTANTVTSQLQISFYDN